MVHRERAKMSGHHLIEAGKWSQKMNHLKKCDSCTHFVIQVQRKILILLMAPVCLFSFVAKFFNSEVKNTRWQKSTGSSYMVVDFIWDGVQKMQRSPRYIKGIPWKSGGWKEMGEKVVAFFLTRFLPQALLRRPPPEQFSHQRGWNLSAVLLYPTPSSFMTMNWCPRD